MFTVTQSRTVTISTTTATANLRYTLNGTIPSQTNGALIASNDGTASVTPASEGTTLRAIAFARGMSDSDVQEATFYYIGGNGANLDGIDSLQDGTTPAYDANGNLLAYKGWSYTYDAQNRLTSAGNGTISSEFYYDDKNRQIARNIKGTIRISVWDGWDLIEEWSVRDSRAIDGKAGWPNERGRMSQYANASTRTAAYLPGAQGVIKSLLNNVYYYQDKLGSTTHVANVSGQLLESYRYDLYGTPSYFNSTSQPINSSTVGVTDLYAGERWIPELALYDLRNRFMSPELGRFLQPDPIGFKGDASNLYRYCHNDPEDFTDPTGLYSEDNRYSSLTSLGGGEWVKDSNGMTASDFNHRQPAGNITVELVPAGDRNQHVKEQRNTDGTRMSGHTVPDLKVLPPQRQKDGTWKVTALYIVDVYYADAPGSKAGPKTMDHTYKVEWQHA